MRRIDVAPPSSVVLVMDPSVGQVPELREGASIAALGTCVAVGTLCEIDGSTRISLGAVHNERKGYHLAFDGVLETPARRIAVVTVQDEVLVQIDVESDQSKVRIWTNDEKEPSEIEIEVCGSDE